MGLGWNRRMGTPAMSINVDGNMAALARYEREQDRLQQLDDRLERLEGNIWDSDILLLKAVRRASESTPIDDAVEAYAKVLLDAEAQA